MENNNHFGHLIDDTEDYYTLQELCVVCSTDKTTIIELIEHGIIEPDINVNEKPTHRFSHHQLRRSQQALKLAKQLELDLPSLGLSLDLLEEVHTLRQELNRLEMMLRRFM